MVAVVVDSAVATVVAAGLTIMVSDAVASGFVVAASAAANSCCGSNCGVFLQ